MKYSGEINIQNSIFKKGLALVIICLFVEASVITVLGNKENSSYLESKVTSIFFSEPIVQEKDQYLSVKLKDANSCLMKAGEPILPVFIKVFKFPIGTKIEEVECRPLQINQKIISGKIQPSPEPVPLMFVNVTDERNVEDLITKDYTVYNSSDFFPDRWYDYRVGCGLDGSDRVVFLTVRFFPVRYSPAQNLIQFVREVDIVVNYEEPIKPVVFPDVYDLLIITTSEFSNELEPLVNHKNDRGISTKLVTLDEIKNSVYFQVEGYYNREKTKHFIKNAIESWGVEYVLLVGGSGVGFTVCYSWIPEEGGSHSEEKFPSDLYYADIYKSDMSFASWDANGNDKPGEYTEDNSEVDLYPDVYIGRLPCKTEEELSISIDKIIDFENNNIWMDKILVCGGDTHVTHCPQKKYDEGEYIQEKIIENMSGFDSVRLWVPGGYPDKGDKQLSAANITLEINKAEADFIDFSGHGGTEQWATCLHGIEDSWIRYSVSDVDNLTNIDKLPIVTLHCCYSCRFTRTSVDKCLGWAFISNPTGGSIATFGNTCLSRGYVGKYADIGLGGWLDIHLYKNLYENRIIGETWANTLNEYISNFIYGNKTDYFQYRLVEMFILFGDPTLNKIIDAPPEKPDRPSGPKICKTGQLYTYSTSTTDPNGNHVYYLFDWGDGNFSKWLGPYNSGMSCEASHVWYTKGTYEMRVRSRDNHALMSEWSNPLSITLPKNKAFNTPFYRLLENYPHMFPLSRHILAL